MKQYSTIKKLLMYATMRTISKTGEQARVDIV